MWKILNIMEFRFLVAKQQGLLEAFGAEEL